MRETARKSSPKRLPLRFPSLDVISVITKFSLHLYWSVHLWRANALTQSISISGIANHPIPQLRRPPNPRDISMVTNRQFCADRTCFTMIGGHWPIMVLNEKVIPMSNGTL
ncbi:hypothetical protein PAAG_11555 [Paracoccidioides lutzii Pb01]|uniref:Uncharacterized protein n=1 Tax=Paracoccidioides lutzii (strain ATCC MYA-826 / Pb01) TaxID=502779 RepID=A0A0A2V2M4_PARBA|nr:hypothetical protein PAAG_11555 [Paracoccidioides lutzii Pb01]KGQ01708.1 hypothetical protein PAAG_11555 [Paracoccidioides lutzii Pb01]